MGDIFISYSREDRLAAERLAEALKSNGWSVWWDPDISPGEIWDELIERELSNVSCVVVLWSATSVNKQWVKAEATEAQARGILVPALIENVKPPLAFRQIQAAPLADWRGEREHAGFQQLLCTICKLVGSRPQQVCQPDRKTAGSGRRAATSKKEGMRSTASPQPSPRRSTGLSETAALPPLRAEIAARNGIRHGDRLRLIGGATALLLLGGGTGYALNDAVQRLYQHSASAEIAERASSPGCEPARDKAALSVRPIYASVP